MLSSLCLFVYYVLSIIHCYSNSLLSKYFRQELSDFVDVDGFVLSDVDDDVSTAEEDGVLHVRVDILLLLLLFSSNHYSLLLDRLYIRVH